MDEPSPARAPPSPAEVPELAVKNPELWWPAQMGKPALHTLELQFETGGEVSPHYDSMLAKLIAWGPTRPEATRRLRRVVQRAWSGIRPEVGPGFRPRFRPHHLRRLPGRQ